MASPPCNLHTRAHRVAMSWVDSADALKSRYSKSKALQVALAFEVIAARSVGDDMLTRAVLYRSSATIAHQAGATKAAVELIAELLETRAVPQAILPELAEVLRALDLRGTGTVDEAVALFSELAGEYNCEASPDSCAAPGPPPRAAAPSWAVIAMLPDPHPSCPGDGTRYQVFLASDTGRDFPLGGAAWRDLDGAQAFAWAMDEEIRKPQPQPGDDLLAELGAEQ